MYGIVKGDAETLAGAMRSILAAQATLTLTINLMNELSYRLLEDQGVLTEFIEKNHTLEENYRGLGWEEINEILQRLIEQTAQELHSVWSKNFSGLSE